MSSGDDLAVPSGFKFGAASSSYQTEGAWDACDKTPNIWDTFTHKHPYRIKDQCNGDTACDSYRLWKRDIEMVCELGVDFYRFSINWPRLLPNGFANIISEEGKNYYNNLIDGLLENGIEPVVTLYHWELPQRLQDLGGWTNPLISDWFADYARVVFSLFADRVQTWITINEPSIMCDLVYNTGNMAPGIKDPDHATYLGSKHTLIAHAKAWRIYDEEFKPKYHGKVSLSNHLVWFEGDDDELTELAHAYGNGRFTHPIYSKEGGWPSILENYMAEKSRKEGYPRSRLPEFTQEEIELCRGTYDFFGINFYVAREVSRAKPGDDLGPFPIRDMPEIDVKLEVKPEWAKVDSYMRSVYPKSIRHMLNWVKDRYGDVEILITENGFGLNDLGLNDQPRVNYYRDYIDEVIRAKTEDGVNVLGYTTWTLMDNFEWMDGFSTKYGLYEVDFGCPEKTRTPRASALFYKNLIASRKLPPKEIEDEV